MVLLGPEPGRGGPSPNNAFSRPYATPDKSLVQSFKRIQPRQSPALKQLVRRPGAQQLEPLSKPQRRAGRPSPSLWPQQTGLASATGLACQAKRTNADRAKQRRRRGGNHVCVCQVCGQRTQQPAAASEQLGRLELKWGEIRDHAVWKDAGFSGTTLQTLEHQLDKIHRQMVAAHEDDASAPSASAKPDSKPASPQHPQPEPEPQMETGQDPTKLEDTTASRSPYLAASAPKRAAAAQVEAEPRALVMDSLTPERLLAAAKGGNPDDIRDLIEAGVDFNVASEAGGLAGIDRCLVLAAIRGHDAAVSILLSAGADATVTQNGTSLLELVQKQYQEVARSPPGSPNQSTVDSADGSIGTLSLAAHRDLLEGLQATEQILMKASELQQSNNE